MLLRAKLEAASERIDETLIPRKIKVIRKMYFVFNFVLLSFYLFVLSS